MKIVSLQPESGGDEAWREGQEWETSKCRCFNVNMWTIVDVSIWLCELMLMFQCEYMWTNLDVSMWLCELMLMFQSLSDMFNSKAVIRIQHEGSSIGRWSPRQTCPG